MILIQWNFSLYLFSIFLLINKIDGIYYIQCCTGNDNTCSSIPVDCPSNICFKLVINKITEDRGCLNDLINLLNSVNKGNRTLNDGSGLTSRTSNDECHRLGTYGNGMSLCKCTSHLCNSSLKQIHLTKSLLFLIYFLRVFLS